MTFQESGRIANIVIELITFPKIVPRLMTEFEQAQEAMAQGNLNDAIGAYTRALESDNLSLRNRTRAHNARGNAHLLLDDFEQALEDFNRVIELNPKSPFSYQSRSLAYFKSGRYNEAITDFTRTIQLDPDYVYAYIYRSDAYFRLGLYDHAIADYEKLLELNPDDIYIYFNRGLAYFYNNNYEKAESDFEQCLELDSQDAQAMIWLYLTRQRDGRTGELQLVAQSKNMKPRHWPHQVVFMLLDNLAPELLLEDTTDPNPEVDRERLGEAYFFIGQYHLLRGQDFKARENFQKCVETSDHGFLRSAALMELTRLDRPA